MPHLVVLGHIYARPISRGRLGMRVARGVYACALPFIHVCIVAIASTPNMPLFKQSLGEDVGITLWFLGEDFVGMSQ